MKMSVLASICRYRRTFKMNEIRRAPSALSANWAQYRKVYPGIPGTLARVQYAVRLHYTVSSLLQYGTVLSS